MYNAPWRTPSRIPFGPSVTCSISLGPRGHGAGRGGAGGGRVDPGGAARKKRRGGVAPDVVDEQLMAGAQELAGHGIAHAADADEPDFHRGVLPAHVEGRPGFAGAPPSAG